jgi:hypothetical protein
MITAGVNASRDLQRYMFLYVYGIYSCILTNIIRIAGSFEIRRASTSHQLLPRSSRIARAEIAFAFELQKSGTVTTKNKMFCKQNSGFLPRFP